jgi:hypothetical protein
MTSESTRFLGHPSETKPTVGREFGAGAASAVELRGVVGESTAEDGTLLFYGSFAANARLQRGAYGSLRAAAYLVPEGSALVELEVDERYAELADEPAGL